MTGGASIADDDIDAAADAEIAGCLTLSSPRSFFLFAGAGSGKTRSLVTALNHVRAQSGAALACHSCRSLHAGPPGDASHKTRKRRSN